MQFTLTYSGALKAASRKDNRVADKQQIRREFHKQLKVLWKQRPLSEMPSLGSASAHDPSKIPLIHECQGFTFVPLVSTALNLVAELHITLLRPEEPGSILVQSGDIDNRLKTLFDAFKVPTGVQIPKDDKPRDEETPFYCLLEDDSLVTKVSITTDRLLTPNCDSGFVSLLVHVTARPTIGTLGNLFLA